jgi:hypothetical protein
MSDQHTIQDIDSAPSEMSLADLYQKLLAEEELIVTIPREAEETLRKGLSSHKYKLNQRLKREGIPPDDSTFTFQVTESKSHPGAVDVHIFLAKKSTIPVLEISKPDNEL